MAKTRRIHITHDDYKLLDAEFNLNSARNAPAGALVNGIIDQNAVLKKRVLDLEYLLHHADPTDIKDAEKKKSALNDLDEAVLALKRTL